jgi:hypothetical protein
MRTLLALQLVLLCALASGSAVRADTVVQNRMFQPGIEGASGSCTPAPQLDRFCFQSRSYTGSFDIDGFDPALGTLSTITIGFSTTLVAEFDYAFESGGYTNAVPHSLDFDFGMGLLGHNSTAIFDDDTEVDTSCDGVQAGEECSISWQIAIGTSSTFSAVGLGLVGLSPVTILYDGGWEHLYGGSIEASWSHQDPPQVSFEATYDYVPVPEPTTALLLIAGCAVSLRRR